MNTSKINNKCESLRMNCDMRGFAFFRIASLFLLAMTGTQKAVIVKEM